MFQVLAKYVRKEKEIDEKICFETEIGILETRIITTIVLKGESSRPI